MKKGLFLLLFILNTVLPFTGVAQNQSSIHKTISSKQKHRNHQQSIARLLKNKNIYKDEGAAKTTLETAERLKAQSDYGIAFVDTSYGFNITDSFRFNYSGDRSSYFNYNFMEYYNTYYINGAYIFGFGSSVGFQDHNDLPDMLSDTDICWQINPLTFSYELFDTRYSTYNTDNNIIEYADDYAMSGLYLSNRYVNTYDVYTNIAISYAFNEDTTAWDTSEYRIFTYNTSHYLVMDSTNLYIGSGFWVPEEKYIYTYDSYNNIIQASYFGYDTTTSTWAESERYIMTYYTDNKLKTLSDYSVDVSLTLNTEDTFGWTTGVNYITYTMEKDYLNDTLDQYTVYSKHISTDTLPDTMYTTNYDYSGTVYGKQRTWYIYDSYSEPTLAETYTANDGTGAYDSLTGITYYYYETFAKHAPNAVPTIAATPEQVKVYPNPTTNTLNICRPNAAKGAYTLIKLINAAGQTVHTESLPWLSETETVSMAGLAPGVYWLTIQTGADIIYRQSVVKE